MRAGGVIRCVAAKKKKKGRRASTQHAHGQRKENEKGYDRTGHTLSRTDARRARESLMGL